MLMWGSWLIRMGLGSFKWDGMEHRCGFSWYGGEGRHHSVSLSLHPRPFSAPLLRSRLAFPAPQAR